MKVKHCACTVLACQVSFVYVKSLCEKCGKNTFSGCLPTLQEWGGCNNREEAVINSFLWESWKWNGTLVLVPSPHGYGVKSKKYTGPPQCYQRVHRGPLKTPHRGSTFRFKGLDGVKPSRELWQDVGPKRNFELLLDWNITHDYKVQKCAARNVFSSTD